MAQAFNPLWLKRRAQILVERLFGFRVYVYPRPTSGHQDFADLELLGCRPKIILDVGANVGQTAVKFRAAFPDAAIHCFEPVSSTYKTLVSNMEGSGVSCHRLALAAEPGEATIYLTDLSVTSSLVKPERPAGSEVVHVSTVDEFCAAHGIAAVDLLKIDAEGFDLEVLRGAQRMLSSGHIAFGGIL